jgi:hypothetical protein
LAAAIMIRAFCSTSSLAEATNCRSSATQAAAEPIANAARIARLNLSRSPVAPPSVSGAAILGPIG